MNLFDGLLLLLELLAIVMSAINIIKLIVVVTNYATGHFVLT